MRRESSRPARWRATTVALSGAGFGYSVSGFDASRSVDGSDRGQRSHSEVDTGDHGRLSHDARCGRCAQGVVDRHEQAAPPLRQRHVQDAGPDHRRGGVARGGCSPWIAAPPIIGSTMVRRSGLGIAPLVKRTRPGSRRPDLNRGNPPGGPAGGRCLLSLQCSAPARGRPSRRVGLLVWRAHHGATSCLARFHALRNDAISQPTDSCAGSTVFASRSAMTRARPQLSALRRAPKCDRTNRARSASAGHSTSNFAAVTIHPDGSAWPG